MARKKKKPAYAGPPAGSYDPALDAQRRAAGRGLGDLTADIGTAGTRDTVDYGLSREEIQRNQSRGLEDLTQSRDRGLQDIDRNVQMLQRNYARLGDQQRQSINAAGLGGGGAALQAASKRTANEAFDQAPLDQARTRIGEDFTRQSTRLGEDASSQLGRLALDSAPPDAGNPLGGRSFQDRTTQLTRAQREDTQFGLDVGEQKAFQAAQSGWVPPASAQPLPAPLRRRRGRRPGLWGTAGRPRYGANF